MFFVVFKNSTRVFIDICKKHIFLIDGEKNMTGTEGQQRVPTDYLKSCIFPIPPLAEQHRIVAKVDETHYI